MIQNLWLYIAAGIHSLDHPFLFGALLLGTTALLVRFRAGAALPFFLSGALTFIAGHAMKTFFAIERPTAALLESNGYGFPSLHTAIAAAFITSVWWSFGRTSASPFVRWLSAAAAACVVVFVAASRMTLSVHSLPDVLAGAALGAGTALLVHFFFRKYGRF